MVRPHSHSSIRHGCRGFHWPCKTLFIRLVGLIRAVREIRGSIRLVKARPGLSIFPGDADVSEYRHHRRDACATKFRRPEAVSDYAVGL